MFEKTHIILIFLISFICCSVALYAENPLLGKWETNIIEDEKKITVTINLKGDLTFDYIVLTKDGSQYNGTGTYSIKDSTIQLNYSEEYSIFYIYEIINDRLFFKDLSNSSIMITCFKK